MVTEPRLPAKWVVRTLEQLAQWRVYPQRIRVDNGPEFISATLASWAEVHYARLDFVRPGPPDQNTYIERFNYTYREDVLDFYLFRTLEEVRHITQQWIHTYNHDRLHVALAGLTPAAWAISVPLCLQNMLDSHSHWSSGREGRSLR